MGFIRHSAGTVIRLLRGRAFFRQLGRCFLAHGVSIREASLEDVSAVHRWLNPNHPLGHSPQANPNATQWVATWRGEVVGFVELVRLPNDQSPQDDFWLYSLHVSSPLRGAGIGEKLSQMVIERARSEGAQVLDLLVFNDNHNAIGLYRKLGFNMFIREELEPQLEKETTPNGRRRVVMRKKLVDPT